MLTSLTPTSWIKPTSDELVNAICEAEAKAPEDLTEYDRMALLGRPKSGANIRAQLRIKESKEFKVSRFGLFFFCVKCEGFWGWEAVLRGEYGL